MTRLNVQYENRSFLQQSRTSNFCRTLSRVAALTLSSVLLITQGVEAQTTGYQFNDSHFHLTNYIQEGTTIRDFLNIMGGRVGRVALFGIPLQQQWSYRVDAGNGPTYYLNSD